MTSFKFSMSPLFAALVLLAATGNPSAAHALGDCVYAKGTDYENWVSEVTLDDCYVTWCYVMHDDAVRELEEALEADDSDLPRSEMRSEDEEVPGPSDCEFELYERPYLPPPESYFSV